MMPEMSGYELAAKIAESTDGKTKMIALSSNVFPGAVGESQKSGFAGFLAKPVRHQVLLDLIRTVLGLKDKQPESIVTKDRAKEIIAHDVRILYAEDNPVNQKLGEKMFKRMGYDRIEIAKDGAKAVEFVKENGPFDIVLMDIQMPNMDGMEATKEIRKWETHNSQLTTCHLPIVALTANAMKGDKEKYLEAGMDDYLSKPFKKEDIQKVISKWARPVVTSQEKRILLVDDEEKARNSIIRVLKKEMPSAKVMTAEDGIDAGAKLGSFMPDLILADIMMPNMDGAEFIRYIRDTERYARTKIIAMTGLGKNDSRVSAVKETGVENILYKPFENHELIGAVRQVFVQNS